MRTPARTAIRILAAALVVGAASFARAQDEPGEPTMDEVKKKVLEIERLMKSAESSLARTTDTRTAEEKSADAARKMLDEKARQQTGHSAEELRKLAEGSSDEAKKAAETLERLTKSADAEAKKAAEKMSNLGGASSSSASKGVKELIDEVKGEGKGASAGIQWILEKAVKQGPGPGGGGGGGDKKDPKPQKEPEKPQQGEKPEKPQDTNKKPPDKTEPPHTPEFEQWLAELPPQVRKAYDTQDWDSIPPKWRDMIRAWATKLSKEDGKERR